MDFEIILKHKLSKLHTYINCNNITIDELVEISFPISEEHKCETCYKEYLQYNELNQLLQKVSKKKNKTIKESIQYLFEKGAIDQDLIDMYKKFKRRFVNGIFDYCHHNTLISFNKLENLLKQKDNTNYKDIFDKVKFNYDEFYSCPHFKRPEKVTKLNLSEVVNSSFIPYKVDNINQQNKEETTNEFVNDIIPECKEQPVWEKKITNYKKSNENQIKPKPKPNVNQEFEIEYSRSLIYDIYNLKYDYLYSKEREKLICQIEELDTYANNNPYNTIVENKLFLLERKLQQDFNDSSSINSFDIHNSIIKLLKKNINIYNQDSFDDEYKNIVNIKKLKEAIKDALYNIEYGNEIIDCCEIIQSNLSKNIMNKFNFYKDIKKKLIKDYYKIINGNDDIIDVSNQNPIHHH